MKKPSMFCLLCSLSVASSSIQLLMHSFNGMKTSSVFQHKLKTHWNSLFCGLNNYQILLYPLENTQKQSVKHSNKSYIYMYILFQISAIWYKCHSSWTECCLFRIVLHETQCPQKYFFTSCISSIFILNILIFTL